MVGLADYADGSVVTGRAITGVCDVDLLTIGLPSSRASQISAEPSSRFADICRGGPEPNA